MTVRQINTAMNPAFVDIPDSSGSGSGFTNQGEQIFSIDGAASILITMLTSMGSSDYLVFVSAGRQAGAGAGGDSIVADYRIVDDTHFWIDLQSPETCVVSWGTAPVNGSSSGGATPSGPAITVALNVAAIPSASSLARQQVWLASLSAMLFSDGANFYYLNTPLGTNAKLDRFVASLIEVAGNVWPLDQGIPGTSLQARNLGSAGFIENISNSTLTGVALYPATTAQSVFFLSSTGFALISGLPTSGAFTMVYFFYPLDLQDDPSGYDAVGWENMYADIDSGGHLRFTVSGSQIITSAGGVIVPGTSYMVAITYDGVGNFNLYRNGALVGTSAGVADFTGFVGINISTANMYAASEAYAFSVLSGAQLAALYATSQVVQG